MKLQEDIKHFFKYRIFSAIFRMFFSYIPVKTYSKLIIGAANTGQNGYLSTDIDLLDITKEKDWSKLFYKESLTNIVAEHVFEHLTHAECQKAFKLCFEYLRDDGVLRIAVPDKNRKDKDYVKEVAPPSDGHKSYFSDTDLKSMLVKAGFKVRRIEWHDKDGYFHHKKYDNKAGRIQRSFLNDKQKRFKIADHFYTSLIVDAIK